MTRSTSASKSSERYGKREIERTGTFMIDGRRYEVSGEDLLAVRRILARYIPHARAK